MLRKPDTTKSKQRTAAAGDLPDLKAPFSLAEPSGRATSPRAPEEYVHEPLAPGRDARPHASGICIQKHTPLADARAGRPYLRASRFTAPMHALWRRTVSPGHQRVSIACLAALLCAPIDRSLSATAEEFAAALPQGVRAVWDIARAHHDTTPTRERICLNGLWRWQPADAGSQQVPEGNWGYFKVPGCWPGITDYLQKDSQTVHAHPAWKDQKLGAVSAAWYEREFAIPSGWTGRQIQLHLEYLNSFAVVYVDGARAGELRFPGGELDLSAVCRPGTTHRLSLQVVALPLQGVLLSYTDSASAREVKGSVARRGLCGDVYLVSNPSGPRLCDVKLEPSVRRKELRVAASLEGLVPDNRYTLRGRVIESSGKAREFTSPPFTAKAVAEAGGEVTFTEAWMPENLWDLHTPTNTCALELSLLDAGGRVCDAFWPERFGFREFWIEGRDFYLNGSRVLLCALPLDNAQVGAAQATYAAARESLERLQSFGINFVYTHNYGCEPGSHLGFAEILRAADDVGMLVALSQPHFSHYSWSSADADRTNGYDRHAAFYARAAGNHPSVVLYAMSHNSTGYNEDMNPDMIDGIQDARDQWAQRNVRLAQRAEAIVSGLDPSRIVYHHASGNLGPLHAINFYPNFVPVQEMSDWFEHWATRGVKPVFLCEYGTPFTWDWAMYRGWYRGKREFGSAVVPWEFCLAEWNAQFFGDQAFRISEMEKRNLRWEAAQFRAGKTWHRWDYPHQLGSADFPEREPVFAQYYADNWRAFRTWGVSAISPWEHHILFTMRPGLDRNRRENLPVDWDNLQQPGFSPDYLGERYERMDLAYARSDWVPTAGARALMRNNRPLLAYITGKPVRFTSKDHLFQAGETVEKQVIVINSSRQRVKAEVSWSLALPLPMNGRSSVDVDAGQQARIPLRFVLPPGLIPGEHPLTAKVTFDTSETQEDAFAIRVLPQRPTPRTAVRVALFDPRGETGPLLRGLGVPFTGVDATSDLGAYDLLVVGKAALTLTNEVPNLNQVRKGLKVLVFEQTPEVLEQRLGFRVAAYGLRQVFPRVPDHPALAGLRDECLRDWRGEATILPPRLKYQLNPKFNGAPTVTWCGLEVTRAWRCGCQGNVASVLIEKPACGDFLPILDGGFSLQYSPLLEFREGQGIILFCQMDVTGRTENEPVAETLVANLLEYVGAWKPSPPRTALYTGEPEGKTHLGAAGFHLTDYAGGELKPDRLLIAGPRSGEVLVAHRKALAEFVKRRGRILALGLTPADAEAFLPFRISLAPAEHINAFFEPPEWESPLAGVGPADVHNRDPRAIPLVAGGADPIGDGVLAVASGGNVVFCQLVPWQFDYRANYGLKRTFRRTSFLVTRLLSNLGVPCETPLLHHISTPVREKEPGRWLQGLYLDEPEEWDDPYRFFRW